jgi:hypothetical protein
MPERRVMTGNFQLMLEGVRTGFLKSVDGGLAVAEVVSQRVGSSPFADKHLGQITHSPLVLQCGLGMGRSLFDWINASWTGRAQRKDGSIIAADHNLVAVNQRDFVHALITETTLPALDRASKEAGYFTITLAPEYTRDTKPSGKMTGDPTRQRPWRVSKFRVTINGLDCTRIQRVDALTVRQAVTIDNHGEVRDLGRRPGNLEFPNLTITLAESGAETWFGWFEDFVIKGNNERSKERNGSIAFLTSNSKDEILLIDLFNLGIFKMDQYKAEAQPDSAATVTAHLYCERMELHVFDKAPKPPLARLRKSSRRRKRTRR